MQAGAGLLTFGPSAAKPEIQCGNRGSEGTVRSVKFLTERPFPARSQNFREASGRSHFTAPADYSGGTVADFHGLPVPPAISIFIRSLCGAARSVNRAQRLVQECQQEVLSDLPFKRDTSTVAAQGIAYAPTQG
jgi:hypothetical protein